MKIAIVSNCQGEGLALCLNAMNPSIHCDYYITTDVESDKVSFNNLLKTYDYVFAHKNIAELVTEEFTSKVIYFPRIAYSAFQPDITYMRGKKKGGVMETVESSMVSYHSSIAVFGYLNGISIDKIIGFYNPYVFSCLGYLDCLDSSRESLLLEGVSCEMPLVVLLSSWIKRGCFMYSFNHPEIKVIEDIAIELLRKIKIPAINKNVNQFINDPLKAMPVWPVYPEIATRYGLQGDYCFKRHDPHGVLDLRTFIEDSYARYDKYEPASLEPLNFNMSDFNRKLGFSNNGDNKTLNKVDESSPYHNLPDYQFWKKSLTLMPLESVDPVVTPKFTIKKDQKIATAGSCFAQHIARTLSKNGFNYFVSEAPPNDMSEELAHAKNFGVFSARYGNLYTVRQLLQLFDRAYGNFIPEDTFWLNKMGKFIDPFRPQIEPDGFESTEYALLSREEHFLAVRKLFEEMDIFIFTLGLTEGWRSRHDGAVFPLAPGVAGGKFDAERYEFVNFVTDEVISDCEKFIERLLLINPACKIILTVSPVPLIATYENQHALVATTYSKSVLRVAAEEIKRRHAHVEYFPSYEVITGSYNRGKYFEEDLRGVTEEGVAHVMRLFLKHYMVANSEIDSIPNETQKQEKQKSVFDIVCDEEAIAKY